MKTNHKYAKTKCIRCNLPKIMNNTPVIILENNHTHSLNGFASYIKHTFLNLIMKPASLEIVIFVIGISKMYIICSNPLLFFKL